MNDLSKITLYLPISYKTKYQAIRTAHCQDRPIAGMDVGYWVGIVEKDSTLSYIAYNPENLVYTSGSSFLIIGY